MKKPSALPVSAFWFRRDLRLYDNRGLYEAQRRGLPVLPVYIFDVDLLKDLPKPYDRRVEFIHRSLNALQQQLTALGSSLIVRIGRPAEVWQKLTEEFDIRSVTVNTDYEPAAVRRDAEVQSLLKKRGIDFFSFRDQVIFEKDRVVKKDGSPYTVFTPYKAAWLKKLAECPQALSDYRIDLQNGKWLQMEAQPIPPLEAVGFRTTGSSFPSPEIRRDIISRYAADRDYPAVNGTTRLGVHLRFGTISVRELARTAIDIDETFLSQLIWRDFFMMILHHFPHVEHSSFKSAYDRIPWRDAPKDFERWCRGETGYPLVDAGMRELYETGYMHNRVRMIAASFLTKHLLIDWRLGERYFAEKLLDYELASNNGNWQWAAGSGCDAAPYFRIFNPDLQMKKFDPQGHYVRRMIPEYGTSAYPPPMIDHAAARMRALQIYSLAAGGRLTQRKED